jgi:large subunit ribosomal protein L16
MMQPKKTKYRKTQKGRVRGKANRGINMAYGDFALQVTETGFITARQIEAARIAMTRFIKRGGRVWIRIFPPSRTTSSASSNGTRSSAT